MSVVFQRVQWAWGWTELPLPLVPSLESVTETQQTLPPVGSWAQRREKRMQRWQRSEWKGRWIGGSRSFPVYLPPSPKQAEHPGQWQTLAVPALSRERCFLPAQWVRGTFLWWWWKPVLGASGVGASCQTAFAEAGERGNRDAPLYLSAKTEWDFMRQRKGTSPPAELLIKGLLHTMEMWELCKSEVTDVL